MCCSMVLHQNNFDCKSRLFYSNLHFIWYFNGMDTLIPLFLLIIGFALLIFGADWLVNGATRLAKRLGLSELFIGLTIVAFGTSLPELVVNTLASKQQLNHLVLGNVVGSNLFNLLLIIGVAGLIYPMKIESVSVRREIPFSLLVTILLLAALNTMLIPGLEGGINVIVGCVFLLLFVLFTLFILKKSNQNTPGKEKETITSPWKPLILIALGIAALAFGGNLTVKNAVILAGQMGMSEKMIGLTIISMGTSLPELFTSAIAAFKKNADIALGNIVGSNIFNVLVILGISSLIYPLAQTPVFNVDLIILLAATVFLMITAYTGKKYVVDRFEAAILLITYIGYMVWLIMKG